MSSFATRRLIDAAGTLDPADRALLNLWVNRGLADERLTGLTGMSIEALRGRRERIVARLAQELGLPEPDVRTALEQITPADAALDPATARGVATASAPNGSSPPTEAEAAAAPEEPAAGPEPPPAPEIAADGSPPRRRRGLWRSLLAMIVVVIVIVVVLASAGSSKPHRATARAVSSTTTAGRATVSTPTPAHPTGGPVPAPFAGLPGGLVHASGSVRLLGSIKHLRLQLRVRRLSAPHNGHDQVWLYNSVLDSRPLGRLRAGHHTLTVKLPANARRFRWIDISFQPLGIVNHSGESELRAANPAHTTRARLRGRSARRRRPLHQATRAGDTHSHRRARPRHARPRHARPRHAQRRTTKGSRKARTSK
ncbi:MAG: hypothetical protein ACR2NR_23830 [Solirubrobacteraceae bacterium]